MANEMDANETRYAREMAEEKHQRRFEQGLNDARQDPDMSSDTAGLTAGANDMARQESDATAIHGDNNSEYHDAPGRGSYALLR